jgi:hypothetical protein
MVRSSKNARPRNAPTPILFAASPTTLTKVLELSASAAARVEEGTIEILKLIPGRQMPFWPSPGEVGIEAAKRAYRASGTKQCVTGSID